MAVINFSLLSEEEAKEFESDRLDTVFVGTAKGDRILGRPKGPGIAEQVDGTRSAPPSVDGLGGDDEIIGDRNQRNRIAGGPGSDNLTGGNLNDFILSGSFVGVLGNIFIQDAKSDRNVIKGLGGRDRIDIGFGIDIVEGGNDNDFIAPGFGPTIDSL